MKPSKRLVGDQMPATGLPPIALTKEQRLELEKLARDREGKRGGVGVAELPEWFVKVMRDKNPLQRFQMKLPFHLTGFNSYGILHGSCIEWAKRIVNQSSVTAMTQARLAKQEQTREIGALIAKKIEEKQPLSPEEKDFLDRSSPRIVSSTHRKLSALEEEKKKLVEKSRGPKTAREMRMEVERLCKKHGYSPTERLIELAEARNEEGNYLLSPAERTAVHKMLLPYTAPTMSSVRVGENSGATTIVKIEQLNFVPGGSEQDIAPVADEKNNDVGDAWTKTTGRKTMSDFLNLPKNTKSFDQDVAEKSAKRFLEELGN